ncbi:uncharacterized protein CEXT_510931 [Caerostris extrusa]|uniref:Uncharacterized protein n=1 Tax=Caerostris extrusa TaxID=172846 RepID=A0AAV4XKK9_CAEEX|nr:uncharacterized protein CEXT_510931 [Caerostris extrusa]
MECMTPEVKNAINDLAKHIQIDEEMIENTIETILQTLNDEMQQKGVKIESNTIIKYVNEHKTEVTNIVQQKLMADEESLDEEEQIKNRGTEIIETEKKEYQLKKFQLLQKRGRREKEAYRR